MINLFHYVKCPNVPGPGTLTLAAEAGEETVNWRVYVFNDSFEELDYLWQIPPNFYLIPVYRPRFWG